MRDPLDNISPLDGRYGQKVDELRQYFSEASLMKHRLIVEVEWFIFLCNTVKLDGTLVLKSPLIKELRSIYEYFDLVDAKRVKEIEKITNHDVKAIEYFMKEKLKDSATTSYLEFIHFGCTSEDINNLSYALMLKGAMEKVMFPVMTGAVEFGFELAKKYKNVAMMSRTHGQPATPTTMGKELVNFVARMERQLAGLMQIKPMGKMNGAVGNFNAHLVAYPKVKWAELSTTFVQDLGLEVNMYTTQIEPHDYDAEMFDAIRRFNTVLLDMNRDIWSYVSIGYFKQQLKEGEVGSSTMPHKVNPIDFENSEGNLGLANAILGHLSEKLPLSRWQRDLTDSTVMRNIGSALAYSLLAYKNCIQGLHKLELNNEALDEDLNVNWELLAEPIQMVMRKHGVKNAYEHLKALTRGKSVNKKIVHKFIDGLDIPADDKKRLKSLTPSKYIGLAAILVDSYNPDFLK